CQAQDSIPAYIRLYNEALSLQDSGRYKESLPLLKKTVKEKPDHWEAWNLMAMAQKKTGKPKDALKSLAKAEQVAPHNYQSLKMKGIIHFENKSFSESKAALDTASIVALEEDIDDPELPYYRARLMMEGKSYKD